MKAARALLVLLLALAAGSAGGAQGFVLTSPVMHDGGRVPMSAVYTQCGGRNQSPRLAWKNPPPGTRSYAVTVFDPDAPGGFWHWVAFDISIGAHGLNAGAGTPHGGNAPGDAVQQKNDFGNWGYSGPCPPPGKPHHYVFTVHALDIVTLSLPARFSRKRALDLIRQHTIGEASITAIWGR